MAAAGILTAAEWGLRRSGATAPGLDPRFAQRLIEDSSPLFVIRTLEGRRHLVSNPDVRKTEAQDLPLIKTPGVKRILVAGESSGDMLGAALRHELSISPGAGRYEVLNCGAPGADLEAVERRYRECLAYDPDGIVFLFGHNLFYQLPSVPAWELRLALLARDSALASSLTNGFQPRRAFDDRSRWRALRDFLGDLARDGRDRKLPLVLVTVPANLWIVPSVDARQGDPEYLPALYDYERGRKSDAIAELAASSRVRPHARALFTLADWLSREGRWQEARAGLLAARDLDPQRNRASAAVNGIIRDAASRGGARLVDAEELVSRRAPHGIPGWESFNDSQHAHWSLFVELARRCALALRDAGWKGLVLSSSPPPPESPFNARAIENVFRMQPPGSAPDWRTFSHLARARLPQFSRQGDELFAAALSDPKTRAAAHLGLAEALWRAGRRAQAQAENGKAGRLSPGWSETDLQAGLFRLRSGKTREALAAFRRACGEDAANAQACYFRDRLSRP